MELSSFSENIIKRTFRRGSQSVELQINIDAMVPDYYAVLDRELSPLIARLNQLISEFDGMIKSVAGSDSVSNGNGKKSRKNEKRDESEVSPRSINAFEKEIGELQREIWANRLTAPVSLPNGAVTSLLVGWDVTNGGVPVAVTREVLLTLPPQAVRAIGEFCVEQSTTVKKTLAEVETPETTPGGSPENNQAAPLT